jgi:hypothetical protein
MFTNLLFLMMYDLFYFSALGSSGSMSSTEIATMNPDVAEN